jgi:hypothetical protein
MDYKEEDTKEEKEENVCIPFDSVSVFDETDYFGWRAKMKAYLKKYGVWEIVINIAIPTNKKSKAANQKEDNKNNAIALKFVLDGLPNSIRESLGGFTSAKVLWLKLEEDHQGKMQGKQLEEEEQEQNAHE